MPTEPASAPVPGIGPGKIHLLRLGDWWFTFGRLDRIQIREPNRLCAHHYVVIRFGRMDQADIEEHVPFAGTHAECEAWIAKRFDHTDIT